MLILYCLHIPCCFKWLAELSPMIEHHRSIVSLSKAICVITFTNSNITILCLFKCFFDLGVRFLYYSNSGLERVKK